MTLNRYSDQTLRSAICIVFLLGLTLAVVLTFPQKVAAETKVVILGTGTPVPDAQRAGPGTAVVYNGKAYLFDAGSGVVNNAIRAWKLQGIDALQPNKISHLFITHLHSDHILDYPDLAANLWWRREAQLKVYGPTGTNRMTNGYYELVGEDVERRVNGIQPVVNPEFYKVIVDENEQGGWVVEDGDVRIEAFDVPHGDIKPAFGYRVTTPDRVIVISGDTGKSEKIVEMASGADVLVHEVISDKGLAAQSPFWQSYHASSHTLSSELAEVATRAKPKLLVLTHVLYYGASEETVLSEVQSGYDGEVVLANDLDVF